MIDFKRIAKESKLYNFHSHSPYCDGHAPIEDFIKEVGMCLENLIDFRHVAAATCKDDTTQQLI